MTMEELLRQLGGNLNRVTLEEYIARTWIKPVKTRRAWDFEEIDLARVQLVHQLRQEMNVGDEAMDVVLHLLDQLYGMHERMRLLRHAITRQPASVRSDLWTILAEETDRAYTDV